MGCPAPQRDLRFHCTFRRSAPGSRLHSRCTHKYMCRPPTGLKTKPLTCRPHACYLSSTALLLLPAIMTAPGIYFSVKGYVRAELIINCIVVTLVLMVVSLRVVGRVRGPGLGWDDRMVMAATVCPRLVTDSGSLADTHAAFGGSHVGLPRFL